MRTRLIVLAILMTYLGCGDEPVPVLRVVSPAHFATAVDPFEPPTLKIADSMTWALDEPGRLLLFDVTDPNRPLPLGGTIEQRGQLASFNAKNGLMADQDYELVLLRDGIAGLCATPGCVTSEVRETDGSEWPEETISWPLKLRFSTRSAPTVRGVYLRDSRWLYVRFSQPMNRQASGSALTLRDQFNELVPLASPLWQDVDGSALRVEIAARLDITGLYTLEISTEARGADGSDFDGDGDGRSGEVDDTFVVHFTGSQSVVKSRMVQAPDS